MSIQLKKSLGQHFLMHEATAERIVLAAELSPEDTALEIGPGSGMLTRALLARVKKVIAVETDAECVAELRKTFSNEIESGALVLLHADIRSFNPETIPGPYALVANIPYYLTGEIIRQFLETKHQPASMTVLVQKEVAERIARAKKESLLSLSVKAYGTPRYCFTVPKGAFRPAPKVDSVVLSIQAINRDSFPSANDEKRFFEALHAGFAHKRKQLAKNLESVASHNTVHSALHDAQVPEKARAEDVTLSAWLAISKNL